ncbi:hypothetical protein BT96DRAFT_1021631 [Gymnopus androsaceus JB14]|uniref:Uncharacterized protein n=1 Tax=Gymnopus androsaceus JB14 TaxID=1447944 RepID=A0A6A4HG81_9AGAR|nr:hypothetical protein BT96DRAFT_1021631 [Gymnopus androsaceus JB14]
MELDSGTSEASVTMSGLGAVLSRVRFVVLQQMFYPMEGRITTRHVQEWGLPVSPSPSNLGITKKLFSFLVPFVVAASASAEALQYDTNYDDGSHSLNGAACSDEANGLITKGYTTFDSLPSWPNIGAFSAVGGWKEVTTTDSNGVPSSLDVLSIDHAGEGLINVSKNSWII